MSHYDEQREAFQDELDRTVTAFSRKEKQNEDFADLMQDLRMNPSNGLAIMGAIVDFKNACFSWYTLGRNDEIAGEFEELLKKIRKNVSKNSNIPCP